MNMHANGFWTCSTLVGAFVDLFIAYLLLCGSTIALFAVNFLGLFGLSLPTPYTSLLVDYPTHKVSVVQLLATRKFPYDSILFGVDREEDLSEKRDMELEGEASCSSRRSDGRKVVDMKGKWSLDQRSSVSSSSNWVTCVDDQQSINKDEEHTASILSDFNNYSCHEAHTPMVVKSVTRSHEDIVSDEPNDAEKRFPVNEADKDKMIVSLTRKLEESQAARAALHIELEKERNAAASAADEAMSMILRLQEEKASVKMESRHYQRMIEEKSAYDEEEMNILKEIVLRREREKHFLENQVEAYRQMIRDQNQEDFDFSLQEEPDKTIISGVYEEENGLEMSPGDASLSGETSSRVYDVHVIDNEPTSCEKSNGLDMSVGLPLPPVTSKSRLRRNSTSALDNERTKLDTRVEWLRERLRIVQEGREKLNLSVDKESLQTHLLEDIARQLQDIRTLSAPQTACEMGLKNKRRCRSVSSVNAKSS